MLWQHAARTVLIFCFFHTFRGTMCGQYFTTYKSTEYSLKSRCFWNSVGNTEAKMCNKSVSPWLVDNLPARQHRPLVFVVVNRNPNNYWSNHQYLKHTIRTINSYKINKKLSCCWQTLQCIYINTMVGADLLKTCPSQMCYYA